MDDKLQAQLKEIFDQLPAPIQRAITSADIQKKLRAAADAHKLHLDQWETLEEEVQMTLFGVEPMEKLRENIQKHVGVSAEEALSLAGDVSEIVFAPIREELERELEHPEAKAKEESGVEAARTQTLQAAAPIDSENPTTPAQNPAAQTIQSPTPSVSIPTQPITDAKPAETPALTVKPVEPATPPAPPPTEKAVRAPTSSVYKPGEPSSTRKNVHDDPYRESPA